MRSEGGGGGPKDLCPKNGSTRFSRSQPSFFSHDGHFGLGAGGWGVNPSSYGVRPF